MNRHPLYYFFVYTALIITLLVASYLTSQLIAQRNKKVMLVVAKHDYPKGTAITDPEEMFELSEFRETDAPPGCIIDLQKLRDHTLTRDINEGDLLVEIDLERTSVAKKEFDLDPPGPGKEFAKIIATARKESPQVGTRIDVILIMESKSKEDPRPEITLLHDGLIRAVLPAKFFQAMLEKEGKTDMIPVYYVTIEASADEVARLKASAKDPNGYYIEVRPTGNDKKVDVNKSPKVP